MPLPDHPLTLNGGCNCGAFRYKFDIPAKADRALHPASNGEVTFPVVLTDYCNDCRKATASILPTWICVPINMLVCQVQPADSSATNPVSKEDWVRASSIFYPVPQSSNNWLRFYKSSDRVTRTFCGRCGTNMTYSISPGMGGGWPILFDVLWATLDRTDLEKDWIAPERHCWVECGIKWIETLTDGMPEMPRHPTFKLDETVN